MKTLTEKIVESIMANLEREELKEEIEVYRKSLEHSINDLIRTKRKFDSELSTTLTPRLLSKIEELKRNDS